MQTAQITPPSPSFSAHRFSVAPMLDWSDRHARYFWRLLSGNARLYTEMITCGALLYGPSDRLLRFDASEHPLALQLGGSDPTELAACARLAASAGFDEVNLNCGCPSPRVQNGAFGACLMAKPALVADCIKAMQDACDIEVTIKHRIGIDTTDDYASLAAFVSTIAATGCRTFIVHARKAWLQGLSPKQNREIPPLQYSLVYQLKRDFPALTFVVNGGIDTLDAAAQHLDHVDGVMLGRAIYHNPYLLSEVDQRLFDPNCTIKSRAGVIAQLLPYIERELSLNATLHHITRHILGLYQSEPGARRFRRHLSEHAARKGAGSAVLLDALEFLAASSKAG